FIDTSAENGIGYWYIVCAVNAAGAETCSASIYVEPVASPFSNLDYLYAHLPEFYRSVDAENGGLFLRRFLGWFGGELDRFDATVDNFHRMVAPETATEEFIDYFLWALFGWGWFPVWFTLAQKRQFYADVAEHYARRGTRAGIEGILDAFGLRSRVITRPLFWGEAVWGEDDWTTTGPLGIVVQIFPQAAALPEDFTFWGEFLFGESHVATPSLTLERADYEGLLRFSQPIGQYIVIEEKTAQ
ncbi:MAG: phage tail protein, partial [Pyrinomonadaceae bacterium]